MDHKTAATAGPAMLSINRELMRHFEIFVQKIRTKLDGIQCRDEDHVFSSWSSRQMATSMVSTQLSTFWKKAIGVDLERRVCPTLLRKMATTVVHGNEPSIKGKLAQLMNHDVRTAEKEYFLQEKKKIVAETSSRLRDAIRTSYESDVELLTIFQDENLTLDTVRLKITTVPSLKSYDDKRLYDKVNILLSF